VSERLAGQLMVTHFSRAVLAKPAKRGPKPKARIARRTPLPRATKPIRTRRPLGTVRREAKAAGDLTPEQWAAICEFYVENGAVRCAYCPSVAWVQDHVNPITRGGRHTAANVVPACEPCNTRKGTSTRWQPRRRHPLMDRAA
jgi:5-methylcytosine-specific restriction endonuclease McrA